MNAKKGFFSLLSIKRKVQLIFLIAMIICIFTGFLFFYSLIHVQITKTYWEKNNDKINSTVQSFETLSDNVNSISWLIMFNNTVTEYLNDNQLRSTISANKVQNEIYSILNSFPSNYSVFVFKEDGTQYVNTGIGVIKPVHSVLDEEWKDKIRSLCGSYTIISNTKGQFRLNTRSMIVSFARTINSLDDQQPIGMLVINIPYSQLEYTYSSFSDKNSGFAYIDDQGKIVCSNINKNKMGQILQNKKIYNNDSFNFKINNDIISTKHIENSDLILICQSELYAISGITSDMLITILFVLITISLTMFIINIYINKCITSPITKLSETMKISGTEYPSCVKIKTNDDEIGMLKDCYNEMVVKINNLISEVINKEKLRQKAEMNVIQEQIKPHFLYNTLETIGYMALQNTREEVYDVVETLGNFYRNFLSKGSENVTVEEEVNIVRNYIKLLRLRYDDLFDDEYHIQDDLRSMIVLKLILQPLVENSIYHGIRPKGEHGLIRISIYSENRNMHIVVYDTGIGMSKDQIHHLLKGEDKRSFGFQATINRIKNFYQSEDIVSIRSVEGEFCEIEIIIPMENMR